MMTLFLSGRCLVAKASRGVGLIFRCVVSEDERFARDRFF